MCVAAFLQWEARGPRSHDRSNDVMESAVGSSSLQQSVHGGDRPLRGRYYT